MHFSLFRMLTLFCKKKWRWPRALGVAVRLPLDFHKAMKWTYAPIIIIITIIIVIIKINSVSLPWMYLRCCTLQSNFNFVYFCFKKVESNIPLIPRRDKHLVCPHNITPESNNKITKKVSYSAPQEMNRKQPKEYAYWFSGLKVFKETCLKIVNEKSLDVTRPHKIIIFTIPLI